MIRTIGSDRRWHVIVVALTAAIALGFAGFTGHIWEDYFITFRSSENLARGHGLVYQPGERVHSFTSPLGTLLPALFALGGGDGVVARALWCFRLVSACALAGTVWLAWRAYRRDALVPAALAVGVAAWAFDPKIVAFSVNGMESAFVVLFATWTWHALTTGARPAAIAAGFAGLQWTRPDGCVYFAALAAAWLLFGGGTGPRTETWRNRALTLLKAAALGIAAYLPWIIFAWAYYGSPVPHTIIAKAQRYTGAELATLLALYPWRLLFGDVAHHGVFLPTYFHFGGWPGGLAMYSRLLAIGAALAWVWPAMRPAGRVASAAFFLGGFYVQYIPASPWYYPGWQALGWIAWAYLLDTGWQASGAAERLRLPIRSGLRVGALLIVAVQAALLGCTAWQMRVHQAVIEDGNRRQVGEWLRANSPPRATVFLEPLGYVGYYSGLKMLDYPGLASPEVVAARKGEGRSVIHILWPDWLVLRPAEVAHFNAAAPELLRDAYRFVRAFDARAGIEAEAFLPGRGFLYVDSVFLVYAKRPAEAAPP